MTPTPQQRKVLYAFGPFCLDGTQRVLLRAGEPIPLAPKAFDTLLALVEGEGRVIEKGELLNRIWPDTFVEEGSLTQNISILRRVLGEDDSRQYIQTIPKRGYRFVTPVTAPEFVAEPAAPAGPGSDLLRDLAVEKTGDDKHPSARFSAILAGTAIVVAVIAGAALWGYRWRAAPLTDQDVVVLADFTNSTGDPVFDGTLREALAFQLDQSPFLKVLDNTVIRQDLELMRRSPRDRITNEVARDICLREADKAMLGGSIASLGKEYAIQLQATNCQTGATLAREQVEASDKEHVLQAIAAGARGIRAKLGESLISIQKLAPPHSTDRVTTASIEAFQAYHLGRNLFDQGRMVEAIPFFQRATDLDPDLAFAWSWLASASISSTNPKLRRNYVDKAWALRDKVSEYERLWLTSTYYGSSGQRDKVDEVYEMWERTYPRDPVPFIMLALKQSQTGQFEDALRNDLAGYRMAPRQPLYAGSVMGDYIRLDRFTEAKAVAEKHFEQGFDNLQVHRQRLTIAYAEGDLAGTAKQLQWFQGKPEEYLAFEDQALYARMTGQFRKSRTCLQAAADLAQRRNLTEVAVRVLAPDADDEALLGNCQTVHKSHSPTPVGLALCGDPASLAQAEIDVEKMGKERPSDTFWKAATAPLIRAAVEFRRGRPAKSIELLQTATPYERALRFAMYLRGLSYLRLGQGAEAAGEFRKIADHPGANWGPMYPLSYLGEARGAASAHHIAEARKAYETFFSLWKNADPEVLVMSQARKEYSGLPQ